MISEIVLLGLFCIAVLYAYNFIKKITADEEA